MINKKILVSIFVVVFLTLIGCLPAPPNQAPVITSTPVTTAEVGVPYTYNVDATDPDVGDTLTYTLDIKPTNMSISSTTGLINWVPAVPGTFNVLVKVSDGDLAITQSFNITVIEEEPTPPPTKYYTITTTAGPGGSISPSGAVKVKKGSDKTFTITPDSVFYGIADVLVDGGSVGAVGSHTFVNVTGDHTIHADFILLGRVYNQTKGTHHDTIQEAIDGADNPGNTILVMAGVYSPLSTIVINKDNLTLVGPQADIDPRPSYGSTRTAGSVAEAVIDGGVYNLGKIILIDANNIVINGFEVKSGTGDMIRQSSSYTGTIVKYCIIHDGNGDEGVQLKKCTNGVLEYNYVFDIADPGDALNISDGSANSSIRYNEVYDIGSENAAIYVYGSTNMEIVGNLVHHVTQNDGIKLGAKKGGDASLTGGLIKDNIIYDVEQDGITVYMSSVTVQGNVVYNSRSENGAIYLAYAISNIYIHDNSIYDNVLKTSKRLTSAGILLEEKVDATSVTVNSNNIYNNTPYGVTNETANSLDAEDNWWGDATGPYHLTLNPTGTGDTVSDNVDFVPWSTSPY